MISLKPPRLTLTVLSLYAFLIQGLLSAAYAGAPGAPLCQSQTVSNGPAGPAKHLKGDVCCIACQLLAIAPPLVAPEPVRVAGISNPATPLGETAAAIVPPPPPQARGPPAFV
jgi:hypothetical protein